jgi:hypothetical protein
VPIDDLSTIKIYPTQINLI